MLANSCVRITFSDFLISTLFMFIQSLLPTWRRHCTSAPRVYSASRNGDRLHNSATQCRGLLIKFCSYSVVGVLFGSVIVPSRNVAYVGRNNFRDRYRHTGVRGSPCRAVSDRSLRQSEGAIGRTSPSSA